MKLSAGKTNSARAEAGAWVKEIPNMGDFRVKARGFGNSDDKRIQRDEIEKIPLARRMRGKLSQQDQDHVMNERIKGAILLDWDGLTDDDTNQPVPMTPELVNTMLTDPDYANFRDAFIFAGSIVSVDDSESAKADVKN